MKAIIRATSSLPPRVTILVMIVLESAVSMRGNRVSVLFPPVIRLSCREIQ
jgi:hypothetical protein